MMFGAWGGTDHDESIRIIQRALGAGINLIDTADVYSRGESEEIVGKALGGGRRTTLCWRPSCTRTAADVELSGTCSTRSIGSWRPAST
jgi:predicted aldo/keto reductase-like oxidoreductase